MEKHTKDGFDNSPNEKINRLINQSKSWQPETQILFDQIGIKPGWKCADIGCGPMGVLPSLGERVGHTGMVLGIDENPDYLAAAKQLMLFENSTNPLLVMGNIYHPFFKENVFDLCHSRFILNEKGCGQELLDIMITLTKPGGLVVSQESDWTTWKCYPQQPAWNKIRDAMIRLFEINGGNINAGMRIYHVFRESGLVDINIRSAIMAMPVGHPYRDGLIKYALVRKKEIIGAEIVLEKEFDVSINKCERIVKDPEIIIFSYSLTQVWGTVPEKKAILEKE